MCEGEQRCGNCGAFAMMRCSRCLSTRYCSKECQRSHWTKHKADCAARPVTAPEEEEEEVESQHECAHCRSLTQHRCSNCHKVHYCKKSCQRNHWKIHKNECFPFKVEESPELGRFMVATRQLRAGETIMKEGPLVVGPLEPSLFPCLGCSKPTDASYRCRRCGWPVCGEGCEAAPDHQAECRLCTAARNQVLPLGISALKAILPLRCIALLEDESKKQKLLSLQSHTEQRKNNEKKMRSESEVIQLIKTLKIKFEFPGNKYSLSSFISFVMGIFDVNGFDIPVGNVEIMGLFPHCAMLEHSCSPNTKHRFTASHQIILKAAIDIAEGEHIGTSYTKLLLGTSARRKDLLEHKYFLCQCMRCQDPSEYGTHMSALRCACLDGFLEPEERKTQCSRWKCSVCPVEISAEEAENRTMLLGQEVDKVMEAPNPSILENFISDKTSNCVHYNHFHLFKVRHTLMQMLGRGTEATKEETLKKKETMCQEILDLCSVLDPGNARLGPFTGVALFELHEVAMIRCQKLASKEYPDQNKIDHCVEFCKALLQKCIKVLQDEPEDQPEGKLRIVAQRRLTDIGLVTSHAAKK